MKGLDQDFLHEHVRVSLLEDMSGEDITTQLTVDEKSSARAVAVSREEGVIAGRQLVEAVYSVLAELPGNPGEGSVEINWFVDDGDRVEGENKIFAAEGNTALLLSGERVALNYMQQLSGVATKTFAMVKVAREYGVDIYDTRKTIPHHRVLQKYAVSCGGGNNHRLTLADAVMIKDNHKSVAGGLREALERVGGQRPLIVEIHDPRELEIITDFDIDVLMLDNMVPATVENIVADLPAGQTVEISGGITLDNLRDYCKTDVDRVSVGSLTHSFQSLDISFGLVDHE